MAEMEVTDKKVLKRPLPADESTEEGARCWEANRLSMDEERRRAGRGSNKAAS